MNKERLTFLAQRLRENAANPVGARFDLNMWFQKIDEATPISCGTTACAFGFASLLPEFQAEGLFVDDGCIPALRVAWNDMREDLKRNLFMGDCDDDFIYTLTGFRAAAQFFGISRNDADRLFDPTYYTVQHRIGAEGEIAVANKIEMLVMGKDILGTAW